MHRQVFDFLGKDANFDIKFPAGEALHLVFENAPTEGVRVVTIGETTSAPPLIEAEAIDEVVFSAADLDVVPEGRLCIFNIWQRDGGVLDLVAEGRFVRRATLEPLRETAPLLADQQGPLLLMLGDSIIHNIPGTRPFLEQMVGHKLRFPEGYQGAVGGYSARDIWFSVPETVARIVPGKTVVLVGPVGANQTPEDDSFQEITSYLDKCFSALLSAGAWVVAVPTLLDGMGIGTQDAKKTALADYVQAYETGGSVTYQGMETLVLPHENFVAVVVAGFDREKMKSDVSHPNAAGARFLATAITNALLPLVENDGFAAGIENLLGTAAGFSGSRPATAAGLSGETPTQWEVSRSQGSAEWSCGFSASGAFELSVSNAIDDGTCVLTLPNLQVAANAGGVLNFLVEVDVAEPASGLKSIGLQAAGSTIMTLNPDWALAPGTYFLRTRDAAFAAEQTTQGFQVFVHVAPGASLTVRFNRATAFIADNVADQLKIAGAPPTDVQLDAPYAFTPAVTGGQPPYAFDLAGGTLPEGLSLDAGQGEISGNAALIGAHEGIALRVTDATGATAVLPHFSITVLAPLVPVNLGAPSLDNLTPQVGDVLAAHGGSWNNSPTHFSYQWLATGSEIAGATAATYAVQVQDVGQTLAVRVVVHNVTGASVAVTSAPSAAVSAADIVVAWDSSINTSAPPQLAFADQDQQVLSTSDISGLRHSRGLDVLQGKRYFECQLGPNALGVGIATAGLTALSGGGFGTGRSFWSGGTLFHSGGTVGMGGALAEGDLVQIAVDVPAKLVWVRRNGDGDWNNTPGADPAAGTGGRDISGMTGNLYAYAGLNNDATASVTLHGSANRWAYAAPNGFAAIGSA